MTHLHQPLTFAIIVAATLYAAHRDWQGLMILGVIAGTLYFMHLE